MKYGDLVQYDPIETVVKLKDADKEEEAVRLVKTYVMSDSMADSLINVCIPQLQFDETIDNKGIFIVGNYGTGKSHLMSVISAIAENKDLLEYVDNLAFRKTAEKIAGRFKILRFDIGSTTMPLRDMLLKEIEKNLSRIGIEYHFPPMDQITNNKESLMEMMEVFQEKYPDKGYLIVVDELLDYLKSRKELELYQDLTFLREMGEVCKSSRIRFMSGVQESLFDNPNFQHVAQTILKVKDRYEQIIIRREDISYVVSQRLLKKDDRQKAWIRHHLEKFSSLYKNMISRLEEYVDLYPIHPAFIEVFEKIYMVEKREVLKVVTQLMREMLDKDVPEDQPGLISYDAYWKFIKEDRAMRTEPNIKTVADKSGVLEDIIQHSFTKPIYKPAALRIIYALSVHRLTTGDIHEPIGITVENMKDDLCIYIPSPELEEDFLVSTIQTIMKEIIKTSNGQFITYNSQNQQYYLDMEKVGIDYNVKIQSKAEMLDDDAFNNGYYDILIKALDWNSPQYVRDHRIWQYELMWEEKKVARYGYLFMGSPNERTTAQPPRDFYIYFLKPYGDKYFNIDEYEAQRDEVFFEFVNRDEIIDDNIKKYAAAMSLHTGASSEEKQIYLTKANEYMKNALKWIRDNMNDCFMVRYRGESRSIFQWIKSRMTGDKTLKDYVDMTASVCLSSYFSDKYPDYPSFAVSITETNLEDMFKAAINYLAGKKTEHGAKILASLELLDGDIISPSDSMYAQYYLDLLDKLPPGKVLTYDDIMEDVYGDSLDKKFKLEPEWVVLVLCSLVYTGDITLTLEGSNTKYDATMLVQLANMNPADLVKFKHIERPKDMPVKELKKLFEFLGLPPGQITNPNSRDEAIRNMLIRIDEIIEDLNVVKQFAVSDAVIWGKPVIDADKKKEYKEVLNNLGNFLDSLRVYNTAGKLKNFRYREEDISRQNAGIKVMKEVERLKSIKEKVGPYTSYLSSAELLLKDKDWATEMVNKMNESKAKVEELLNNTKGDDSALKQVVAELRNLKEEYVKMYMDMHRKYRLDINEDGRKKKIMRSDILNNLNKLATIEDENNILPVFELKEVQDRLAALKTCYSLKRSDMEDNSMCPHCGYNFSDSEQPVYGVLDYVEDKIEEVYESWTKTLLNNIEDPMLQLAENIKYLSIDQRKSIQQFLSTRKLPDRIDNVFISAVNDLMKGLEKVEVSVSDIKTYIAGDGPCTVDEIKKKFERYIDSLVFGKDVSKVRIIIRS
ncbi:DUF6079 family protein [Caldanaerobius polysaccharolyticus]|uniref:DUF6079 family protein n=1 Tax=Caldanaerobius polysaccharolyticus TaxID=44256 RepID=UPI00047CF166|nr:DUF6079 family protein [Caldanaerobius polysaccharolyticus]